ncbi:phosphotransferase family protein [Nocardia jinanensis]|uniref:Phosphotransferase n=1 Tax=Nocardia jinanensis TaxID=382504 RepID=A0A917RM32_9NOCA|nr:phosphotransferase family protein [Nocardia jinanensis]GGL13081.1 phosphotransferase [Nocardia jinanensis]
MTDAPATSNADEAVVQFAARTLSLDTVRLQRLPGGASRGSFLVQSTTADDPVAFLRVDEGRGGLSNTSFTLARESAVIRAMAEKGIPVPRILGENLDPPALLMQFLPGRTRLNVELAEQVGPAYMAVLAEIHRLRPNEVLADAALEGNRALQADLNWWTDLANESADAAPYLALALEALRISIPEPDTHAVFLHGDAGAGNFLVDDGRIGGLIDWEMAHTGDFHEDLAWVCMRMVFTPFGTVRQRLADYETASGRTVLESRLAWYKAFVTWKALVAVDRTLRQGAGQNSEVVQTSRLVSVAYQPLLADLLLRLLDEAATSAPDTARIARELSAFAAEAERTAQSDETAVRVLARARAGGFLS